MRYSKKYSRIYYVFAPLGILLALAFTSAVLGGSLPKTAWVFAILLVEAFAVALIVSKIVNKFFIRCILKAVALYNDQCDPGAFLVASNGLIRKMQYPLRSSETWLLNYRCLAFLDSDNKSDAEYILCSMSTSMVEEKDAFRKAMMQLNIYASTKRMKGQEEALALLDEAAKFFITNPKKFSSQLSFIDEQKQLLEAEIAGDASKVITCLKARREDTTQPLRIRVEAAFSEAKWHERVQEANKELACLEFVIAHGDGLESGQAARLRMAELNEMKTINSSEERAPLQ